MASTGIILVVLTSVTWISPTKRSVPHKDRILTVYFCDQTGLDPSTVTLLEKEVRHPFSWAGLELEWRQECPDKALRGDRRIAARVYLLRKLLNPLLEIPSFACRGAGRILGIVLTGKGEPPGEVIYVSRSAVENLTEQESIAPSSPRRARALGRVITHELAHRFLAKSDHSLPGVLSGGAIKPRELTRPSRLRFRFSRTEVELLRALLEDE